MAMERDAHENLLQELMNPDIEHNRKSEILQSLREDYGQVLADQEELQTNNEKLTNENTDLVKSNSKLFRQLGQSNDQNTQQKEQDEKQEFSENVTLEDLGGS